MTVLEVGEVGSRGWDLGVGGTVADVLQSQQPATCSLTGSGGDDEVSEGVMGATGNELKDGHFEVTVHVGTASVSARRSGVQVHLCLYEPQNSSPSPPTFPTPNRRPHMVNTLAAKVKAKSAKYRAPCLCGCGSKSPSTIAAHGKAIMKAAKMKALSAARSVSSPATSSAHHSAPTKHRKSRHPTGLPENHAPEDPMEVDLPQGSGSGEPLNPLVRIWVNRAGRREREDEDLVSDPGSPELSDNDDEAEGNGNADPDEPEFLTDDEGPPIHVQISATEQLSADFQLHAAKAGMSLLRLFSIGRMSLRPIFHAQHRTIWTQMISILSALSTITSQNLQQGMRSRVYDTPSPIKCKMSNHCTRHNGGLRSYLA